MMHDRPEETANAERKEKEEPEEPGIAELHRRAIRPNEAENETDQTNQAAKNRQPGKAGVFKILAFRRGQNVGSIAHFFSGSTFFSSCA